MLYVNLIHVHKKIPINHVMKESQWMVHLICSNKGWASIEASIFCVLYSFKISRGNYFMVLTNSSQKQIFVVMNLNFVGEILTAVLRPVKSVEILGYTV